MTFFKFFNNSLLVILFIYCPRIITQASQEEPHCLICVFCSKSGSRNTAKIYAFQYTFKNKTGQYRKKKKKKKHKVGTFMTILQWVTHPGHPVPNPVQ